MPKLSKLAKLVQIFCGVGLCLAFLLDISQIYRNVPVDLDWGRGNTLWTMQNLLEAELNREKQLEDQLDFARHRLAIETWVVDEVIAERMTLREAAAHFRALNASEPRHLERMRATYPGQSAEESICRNVLAHVRGALYKQPSRQVVVLARLEGELRELVNRYDTVGLQPMDF